MKILAILSGSSQFDHSSGDKIKFGNLLNYCVIKMGEQTITHYNVQDSHDYGARLQQFDEQQDCEKIAWFSSLFVHNNPLSEYHIMGYACYDEYKARNRMNISTKTHEKMAESDESGHQDLQAKEQHLFPD